MLARLPSPSAKERAARKGEMRRALFLSFAIGTLFCGGTLTAQALYIPVKAGVAQILLDRAFERSVANGASVKPWDWADTAPMARITIPHLGVSEVVLSGASGEAMAFGPTVLLDDPARRITVLGAHRDTHFEFVQDVEIGDEISFERISGQTDQFRITQLETVAWDTFTYPVDGGNGLLALTTCFPFGTDTPGPFRRVVWAERI